MTARPTRRLLRRLATPPLLVLASAYLLFEEVVWRSLGRLAGWLARLPAVAAAERWALRQGPYVTLALFGIPMGSAVPVKLGALYLIGTGHAAGGLGLLVGAYTVSTVIAARLYALSLPKLLSIRWFAFAHGALMALRRKLYARVQALAGWQMAVEFVAALRRRWHALRSRLAAAGRGTWLKSLFQAARRRLRARLRRA